MSIYLRHDIHDHLGDHVIGVGILDELPDKRRVAFDDCHILIVLSGKGKCRFTGGASHDLDVHDILIRPEGREHLITRSPASPWMEFSIVVPTHLHDLWRATGILPPKGDHFKAAAKGVERKSLEEILRRNHKSPSPGRLLVEIESLLLDIFEQQTFGTQDRVIERAKNHINERHHQSIDWHALASTLGQDYDQLRKRFRGVMGMSLKRYQIHSRIKHAKDLLIANRMRVSDIALKLGYADIYAFSQQFKKETGLSPKAYASKHLP